MTRSANARTAGFTFLFYIAAVLGNAVLLGRAANGQGIAVQLASIAQHATEVRIAFVLGLLTCFAALVLGVTLYAITREQLPRTAKLRTCSVRSFCRWARGTLAQPSSRSAALSFVASSPRPYGSSGSGMARGPCVGAPCSRAAPATDGCYRRHCCRAHGVAGLGVRGNAGPVVTHQGSRITGAASASVN